MVHDSGHVYKIIELVGSSGDGLEAAIQNAVGRANETLRNLDWFEVREIRGRIENGGVGWYQVKLGVGFRVEDDEEMRA
jgi:flavin-binding protein dodecin